MSTMQQPPIILTPTTRLTLEALYSILLLLMERATCEPSERLAIGPFYETVVLSGIVQVSQILDRPCPIQTRRERRQARVDVIQ